MFAELVWAAGTMGLDESDRMLPPVKFGEKR
jgi:hypothetical protein